MSNKFLKAFLVGSSIPAAAVTLAYIGAAFHKTGHTGIKHYELFPFIAATVLGAFNMGSLWLQDAHDLSPIKAQAAAGASAGLALSLIGHEGLDLPTNIFKIAPEKQYMVHIVAPVLYVGIFTTIIHYLNSKV